jgi:CRISPR type II-A-associated protein Csn2
MILIKDKLEDKIEITSEKATILNIGDINLLYKYVKDIRNQCKGEDGMIKILNQSFPISFEKEVELISSVLDISLNNPKSLTSLRKRIEKELSNTELIFEIDRVKSEQVKLIKRIKERVLINIDFEDDQDLGDLLKFYGIKFNEDYNVLSELLIKYLEILKEYSKIKIVFLVNIFNYFTEIEITEIIKFCSFNDIILVFMEGRQLKNNILKEIVNTFYVDDDILIKIDD